MKNWGEKQWMIATIVGFAVVILGLGGACFYEWNSVIGPKKKTRDERRAALTAEKQNELAIPGLLKEKADLEKKQAEFKEKLPTAAEVQLEAFRKVLTNYATQSNVIITGIRPVAAGAIVGPGAAQAAQKPFEEISFNLDVKGNFATLGNFIFLVETHRRLITIESLDLKPDSITGQGEELPKVIPASLTLKLTTYQFK